MVHEDINMNAAREDGTNPCINPTTIMYNTSARSGSITRGNHDMNGTSPYHYPDMIFGSIPEQPEAFIDDYNTNYQPEAEGSTHDSRPSNTPNTIRRKLYFLVAAHKTVQTCKEFVAVARIPHSKTKRGEIRFVNAQGKAYHYIPDGRCRQFNTSIPLSEAELAGAICDDRAFAVHKATGTSCAPAGTYLVYRLTRTEPGTRNLRFEATWDWGDGITATASYDFVALTAHDSRGMRPYTSVQKRLLSDLWPAWEDYIES
ncbi:hypothetical protein F5B18DRAFT_666875 [Nemania serpens]|nr:hypothetical protein F5B18DRAFT_666875 [Nemania serpens]